MKNILSTLFATLSVLLYIWYLLIRFSNIDETNARVFVNNWVILLFAFIFTIASILTNDDDTTG